MGEILSPHIGIKPLKGHYRVTDVHKLMRVIAKRHASRAGIVWDLHPIKHPS